MKFRHIQGYGKGLFESGSALYYWLIDNAKEPMQ